MTPAPADLVPCPSCNHQIPFARLNQHLDRCLQGGNDTQQDDARSSAHDGGGAASPNGKAGVFGEMMMGARKRKATDDPAASQLQSQSAPSPSGRTPAARFMRGRAAYNPRDSSSGSQRPSRPSYQNTPTQPEEAAASDNAEPQPALPASPTQSKAATASNRPRQPATVRERMDEAAPLAERLRPRSLSEYVGQEDIVKGPLASLLKQGKLPSMILWGPPGTGKTTLARLLANEANQRLLALQAPVSKPAHERTAPPYRFVEVSATTAGTSDVKKIFDESLSRLQLTGQKTVLFIDEVQRFSRAQQDVFLPVVERGQIVLIAATTENPSFRLQSALLSRMRVFVLAKLSPEHCYSILDTARRRAQDMGYGPQPSVSASTSQQDSSGDTDKATRVAPSVSDSILEYISHACDGDARSALQALEIALLTVDASLPDDQNLSRLKTALKRQALHYDRTGDMHYDTISALHKSIRGSDADAALYWLARMVAAGDDPLFIARRLIVAASEDCGGEVQALQMATATYTACQVVGLPECGENLAQCVVFLAECPKSIRAYSAWKKALALVQGGTLPATAAAAAAERAGSPNPIPHQAYPVPYHIRNAPTKLMRDLGYGKEYRYEPRFAHPVYQDFFPPELEGTRFLSPPPSPRPRCRASTPKPRSVPTAPGPASEPIAVPPPQRPRSKGRFLPDPDPDPDSAPERSTSPGITPPETTTQAPPQAGSSPTPTVGPASHTLPTAAGTGPGACQRSFQIGSRAVNLDLLEEWEAKRNGGRRWEGRERLEAVIAAAAAGAAGGGKAKQGGGTGVARGVKVEKFDEHLDADADAGADGKIGGDGDGDDAAFASLDLDLDPGLDHGAPARDTGRSRVKTEGEKQGHGNGNDNAGEDHEDEDEWWNASVPDMEMDQTR